MCCRGISVRFTVVSLLQVVFGSMFLQIFSFQPIFTDEILNVIFGGVIYGTSIVIALRGNASTGGTDFIALFVSNKTGKSIWSYVFFGNALMYCVYSVIFGWKYAGYSIIFQFISTHMISAFHHRYDLVTLQAYNRKGTGGSITLYQTFPSWYFLRRSRRRLQWKKDVSFKYGDLFL